MTKNNYAFIDGQNLNKAIKTDIIRGKKKVYVGKSLNYKKFRHYLYQKYDVSKAYIFLGYLKENEKLYEYLQKCGFEVVFKKTTVIKVKEKEIIKGNVDIDIAVWSSARLIKEYDKAIFVSGDGDFLELYDYIDEQHKLAKIIIPNSYSYSRLLSAGYRSKIVFINVHLADLLFEYKKGQVLRSDKSLGVSGHRTIANNSVAHGSEKSKGTPRKNNMRKMHITKRRK